MKKEILLLNLLFLSILFNTKIYAQKSKNYDFKKIDAHAENIPEKYTKSIKQLGNYLCKNAKNDAEKVRSFYYWITHEVAYDLKTAENTNLSKTYIVKDINQHRLNFAKKALTRKKAVCQGYSELFRHLCMQENIPVHVINGYSKQVLRNPPVLERPGHAWNAVQIDGEWYLLDITWGAGSRRGDKFVAEPNDEWFLTKPSTFALTHLPMDPTWQLLDCPIDLATFKQESPVITNKINNTPACYDYQQKIDELSKLPQREQELQSAINAYEADPDNVYIKDFTAMKYMNFANRLGQKLANNYRTYSFNNLMKDYEQVIDLYEKAALLSDQKAVTDNILRSRTNYVNDFSNKIYYAQNLSIDSTGLLRHKILKLSEALYKDYPKPQLAEILGDAHFNYAVALETKLIEHVKRPTAKHHQKILIHLKEAKKYFGKGRSSQVAERIKSCKRFIRAQEEMIRQR